MPTTDPRRFRHRTAEVEAVQWTGNEAALTEFAPDRFAAASAEDRIDPEDDAVVLIEESHWVAIRPGCWVLKYPDHFDVESDADFRAGWVAVPAVMSSLPATDRATVLREAADDLATAFGDPTAKHIGILAASYLRRRAREAEAAPTTEAQPEAEPETPLEKRLRFSERRNDELRTECLRRGKTVAERGEKIRQLEKQLDEVRGQLGAEILRAGQAEDELRRLADVPAVGARQPDTETRGAWGTRPACRCPHATDEHSVYGCADGCACEYLPPPKPVQHAPGRAVLCPDCRAKGHSVCVDDQPAAPTRRPAADDTSEETP